jgi:hypothetical protein
MKVDFSGLARLAAPIKLIGQLLSPEQAKKTMVALKESQKVVPHKSLADLILFCVGIRDGIMDNCSFKSMSDD